MSEALELELPDDIDVGNSIWVPWKIRLASNSRSFCLSYNNIYTQLQISFADGHNCIHFNPSIYKAEGGDLYAFKVSQDYIVRLSPNKHI